MAITRYGNSMDPFDQMFNTLLGTGGGNAGRGSLMRAPETDVVETEREIRVSVEMPGLQRTTSTSTSKTTSSPSAEKARRARRRAGRQVPHRGAPLRHLHPQLRASPGRGCGKHPGTVPGRRAQRDHPQERAGTPPSHRGWRQSGPGSDRTGSARRLQRVSVLAGIRGGGTVPPTRFAFRLCRAGRAGGCAAPGHVGAGHRSPSCAAERLRPGPGSSTAASCAGTTVRPAKTSQPFRRRRTPIARYTRLATKIA